MDVIRNKRGYTLIEVLVATLVLSTGIMGVAAMQTLSFQTGQGAYARIQAIYLVQDMFERMRANPQGYATTTIYDSIDTDASTDTPGSGCATSAAGCTALQMAQQDVREWTWHFANTTGAVDYRPTLPNGRGTVTRTADTNIFTVTVSWDERGFDAEGNLTRSLDTRSASIQAELN